MLQVAGLQAWYGGTQALHGVDLNVGAGEILLVLGRNGAGRTTAARAIMGLIERAGTVRYKDHDLTRLRPFEIARLGIGYVAEGREVFPALTVEQNIALGCHPGVRGRTARADPYRIFPELRERARVPAGRLSGGEQQMLVLLRALMGEPDLLVVDEPMQGLAPALVERVGQVLAQSAARGVAILLIDQVGAADPGIGHRVCVLGRGRTVFQGTPEQLQRAAALRQEWIEV